MGGRAGGGASGGMGSRSRGGGNVTVFKGGWSGSADETSSIVVYGINKETEKAVNVKTLVSWAKGNAHEKDIWVPKSTISSIYKKKGEKATNGMMMDMKKSMAYSISNSNSFKGYPMEFVFSHNA